MSVISLTVLYALITSALGQIPKACSSEEHLNNFKFCDPELEIDERVHDLINRLTLEEKGPLLTARQSPYGGVPRLGIPEYDWGTNCIHGVQSTCGTHCPTSFPNPNGLGATFNISLFHELGRITGLELRSLYLQGVGENRKFALPHIGLDCWSPNINILRDPRWGRSLETSGEDPLLNGLFGIHYSKGLQEGPDPRYLQAVVTLKHFAVYSLEGKWGKGGKINRFNFNANINEYDFADTYTPAFKMSILKGKAKGVMCSYNAVNGVPACANNDLFKTLRSDWGFDGYVTSDSSAIKNIYLKHKYTASMGLGVKAALEAGCDIDSCLGKSCHGLDNRTIYDATGSPYVDEIPNLVRSGLMQEAVVDRALFNSLKLRFQLGLFDPIEDQYYWQISPDVVRQPSHMQASLEATRQSMTLLQNPDSLLPFSKAKSTAVIGPHAEAQSALIGNYAGQQCEKWGDFSCVKTPLEAVNEALGRNASSALGCDVICKSRNGFREAILLAQSVEQVILMVGLDTSKAHKVEKEGVDRVHLRLPGRQLLLVQEIYEVNKNVVVVLINGGAIALDGIWSKDIAILEAFYPSIHGSQAIAETIFGDNNPSGKLPFSIYAQDYIREVDFLNHDMTEGVGRTYKYYKGLNEQFNFGHGLSYSKFTAQITFPISCDGSIGVRLKNEGPYRGTDVLQLYMKPLGLYKWQKASLINRQLIAFNRVSLENQQATGFYFYLKKEMLAIYRNSGTPMFARRYVLTISNGNDISQSGVCEQNFVKLS